MTKIVTQLTNSHSCGKVGQNLHRRVKIFEMRMCRTMTVGKKDGMRMDRPRCSRSRPQTLDHTSKRSAYLFCSHFELLIDGVCRCNVQTHAESANGFGVNFEIFAKEPAVQIY